MWREGAVSDKMGGSLKLLACSVFLALPLTEGQGFPLCCLSVFLPVHYYTFLKPSWLQASLRRGQEVGHPFCFCVVRLHIQLSAFVLTHRVTCKWCYKKQHKTAEENIFIVKWKQSSHHHDSSRYKRKVWNLFSFMVKERKKRERSWSVSWQAYWVQMGGGVSWCSNICHVHTKNRYGEGTCFWTVPLQIAKCMIIYIEIPCP